MGWEIVTGRVTQPGATITALTANTGDTFSVRDSLNPKLLNFWAYVHATGTSRVRSPLLHDVSQGIRVATTPNGGTGLTTTAMPRPLLPYGLLQPLQKNDPLIVELSGSAVAGQIELLSAMLHYDSLPGSEGIFIDEETLRRAAVQHFPVESVVAPGVTGNYGGSVAINASFDLFKGDAFYALVGYHVQQGCCTIGWRGSDSGALRVGAPGCPTMKDKTATWFMDLSRWYALPLIPVFRANNKAGILVDAVQDEGGANITVTSFLVQVTDEAAKRAAVATAPSSKAVSGPPAPVPSKVISPTGGGPVFRMMV